MASGEPGPMVPILDLLFGSRFHDASVCGFCSSSEQTSVVSLSLIFRIFQGWACVGKRELKYVRKPVSVAHDDGTFLVYDRDAMSARMLSTPLMESVANGEVSRQQMRRLRARRSLWPMVEETDLILVAQLTADVLSHHMAR